jgi:enoyl-CoA hydratase/carnithine racemase
MKGIILTTSFSKENIVLRETDVEKPGAKYVTVSQKNVSATSITKCKKWHSVMLLCFFLAGMPKTFQAQEISSVNTYNTNLKAKKMQYTDYKSLKISIDSGVVYVTINHPPLNVLDAILMTDLHNFASVVQKDPLIQVIVLQSADAEFFIPHGDMNFVTNPESFTKLSADYDGDDSLNPMQKLHEQWRALPQVTIAKISGFARGGGSEFVMAMDMRFGAIGKMGLAQPEVLMGIIPGGNGTVQLPRLIGRARSLEVILGAELFDAELAERYGWINRALPADEIDEFVNVLAKRIAKLAPGVIHAAKAAVDATIGLQTKGLIEENTLLGKVFSAPAATNLIINALKAGAQTREGERNLERLLNKLQ